MQKNAQLISIFYLQYDSSFKKSVFLIDFFQINYFIRTVECLIQARSNGKKEQIFFYSKLDFEFRN